jgi:hypothetical protein
VNLREVTRSQNGHNRGWFRHNTTGFKGVSRNKSLTSPWLARIGIDGKHIHLGCFSDAEEAAAAYEKESRRLR